VGRVPLETNPSPAPGTANVPFLKAWRYGAIRTDLQVGGRILSLYNVHFYDRFYLGVSALTPAFYRDVRGLDEGRRAQFARLLADLGRNPNPAIVSGNLNTLPDTRDLARLDGLKDAGGAGGPLYPATLTFAGMRLWRVDWTLTTPSLAVQRYDLRSPKGLSSHHLQDVVVSTETR
jgi:hypothetical protein